MTLDEEREAGRQHGKALAVVRVRKPAAAQRTVDRYFPEWIVLAGRDQAGPHQTARWEAYKAGFMEGHTR